MAGTDTAVVRLSDLADGQEADCFAALVKKERGTDKHASRSSSATSATSGSTLSRPALARQRAAARRPRPGPRARPTGSASGASSNVRYGLQLEILDIRPASDEDAADGYDFFDLVESSDYDPEQLLPDDPRP